MEEKGSNTTIASKRSLSKARKPSSHSLRSFDSNRSKRSLKFKKIPDILKVAKAFGDKIGAMTSSISGTPHKSAIKMHGMDETDSENDDRSLEVYFTSDSLSDAESYVLQNAVLQPLDFFDELGEIPSVTKLSEDISEHKIVVETPSTVRKSSLEGQFVDPLGGYEESEEEVEVAPPAVEEPVKETTPELSDNEDLLILLGMQEKKDEEAPRKVFSEEAFETFMDATRITVIIEDEIDYAAIEREKREIRNITTQFLEKLIGQVVEVCEWIDPKDILREKLDKVKLMSELLATLRVLEAEQQKRTFLNRKSVEFFRRKKAFRSISDDNPATVVRDEARYQEALIILDDFIGKERELREGTEAKMSVLTEEYNALHEATQTKINEFEDLMKRNAGRMNSEAMQMSVNRMLSEMAEIRKQVSEVRFTLVLRQHTMGQLVEKTAQLEDLGEGLRMMDFERLQTEVQALDKKVEERHSELDKLHLRCNSDINILRHLAEKENMMVARVQIQKSSLQILQRERYHWREKLYKVKLDHARITKGIRELSFQCGLLDKPALMADYDVTTEQVTKMLAKAEAMRATYKNLIQQIESLENKCKIST